MTGAVSSETADLFITRLKKEILGEKWCDEQVARYREFYEQHSHPDMWSHRLPTVSPIVPLLFQHQTKSRKIQPAPLGYWYGDPIHYLRQLAISVFEFEGFWSNLPNKNGLNNIRFKLSEAGQFDGFLFELLVALDAKLWTFKDYEIVPLFFDPMPQKGGPDIVLHKDTDEIAIQCKSRNPLAATNIPFDLFQYFFGYFVRIVYDSGYSYKLSLNLKRKLEFSDICKLLDKVSSAIRVGLDLPTHSVNSVYDLNLTRFMVPVSGLNQAEISKMLDRDRGNLCTEIFASNPFGRKTTGFNRIAICSISTENYKSHEEYYVSTVAEAAAEAQVNIPLILSIHFYGAIDFQVYMTNSADAERLRQRLDSILKRYQKVKYVDLSSYKQEYEQLDNGSTVTRTQHMIIDNNYFTG